jgi:hypothetical protein
MQEVKVNLTTQLKVTKQMVEDASLVAQATTRFFSLDHSICHINAFFHHVPIFINNSELYVIQKPAKKYISIQWGMNLRKPSILVVNWVSSCFSFFLSASTVVTYIFTRP